MAWAWFISPYVGFEIISLTGNIQTANIFTEKKADLLFLFTD